jgi:chemotaxis family two-component system sensor kinase Cph1
VIFSTLNLGARACELPEYHLVDRIQPHAVLVVAELQDLTLVHASANAQQVFGRPAQALIGTALSELIEAPSLERLRAAASSTAGLKPHVVEGIRPFALSACGALDAWIYRVDDKLCMEFMLGVAARAQPELAEFEFARMLRAICAFDGNEDALATQVCTAISAITGFDRVYLCEFDQDGNGHVPAESLRGHFPSLLHHHFPASDLPQKVRQLYVANRFRLIADSAAAPIAVLARPGAATRLDLSDSTCREIGPTHLRYLQNMGAVASTSFSVVIDGRLAALLGAHHHAPRQLSYRQLLRCSQLADSFADRVTVLRLRARQERLKARHAQVIDVAEAFAAAGCRLSAFAATGGALLQDLFDADGVIACDGDAIHHGELAHEDATALLAWCATKLQEKNLVATQELGRDHPEFAGIRAQASGVLGFALDREARSIIVLLKREVAVVRQWAGAPREPAINADTGALQPRVSFDTLCRARRGYLRAMEWRMRGDRRGAEIRLQPGSGRRSSARGRDPAAPPAVDRQPRVPARRCA